MATPHPASRVFVTIDEVRWELIPTGKLTFPETREIKRVSEGMSLVLLEEGIRDGDPDAWFAWIYVSIRRKHPSFTTTELEQSIGDTPVLAIIESVENEVPEVAVPDPPALASLSDADATRNGSDSGEKTPLLLTPETAGLQT